MHFSEINAIFAENFSKNMKIIGLGNALTDVLTKLENEKLLQRMSLPKGSMQLIDEDTLLVINKLLQNRETNFATGGSAANTIKALANLGHPCGFIGKVGDDLYGRFFETTLKKLGVDTKLTACTNPSGVAACFVTPDGERTFGTFLGAASTLKAEELTPKLFKGYTFLYIEGYLVQDHEMILKAIHLAKKGGLKIVLDLASYNVVEADHAFFEELLNAHVDILLANEEEAKAFTGKMPEEALGQLASLCEIAIVKVGKDGAYIQQSDLVIHSKASPTQAMDSTGAGDYFAAGFLLGYAQGLSLQKCGDLGNYMGGEVIQEMGTTLSALKWEKIRKRVKEIVE